MVIMRSRLGIWSVAWCFITPGVCAFGAEIALVPVAATGTHTISGNEIILNSGGQRVTLEILVSGWAPEEFKAYQASLDSSGYSSGLQGTLTPEVVACHGVCNGGVNDEIDCNADTECNTCELGGQDGLGCVDDNDCPDGSCEGDCDTSLIAEGDRACRAAFGAVCGGFTTTPGASCVDDADCPDISAAFVGVCEGPKCAFPTGRNDACEPGFILEKRLDYVFLAIANLAAVNLSVLDYQYGSAASDGGTATDPGSARYLGTLILHIPVEALGTFTIDFLEVPTTLLLGADNELIVPLDLIPARITVLQSCSSQADCDDENLCTIDTCVCSDRRCTEPGTCSFVPNFEVATQCCNPTTGDLCPKPTGLPADFDASGTADLLDLLRFTRCFGQVPLAGVCESVDMDCDCDADLDDWKLVAPVLTGP